MTLSGFEPLEIMTAFTGEECHQLHSRFHDHPLLLFTPEVFKLMDQEVDASIVAFATQFSMLGGSGESLGDHYFHNSVNLPCIPDSEGHESCIVEELVIHSEPAVEIPPDEASELVDEQHASWLMHNADAPPLDAIGRHDQGWEQEFHDQHEKVFLFRITRNPRELEDALLQGRELEEIRLNLSRNGCRPCLPSGAAIFVHPDQYRVVRQALSHEQLRPYHIIVSETFRPMVEDVISSVPSRLNVRLKDESTIAYVAPSGAVEDSFVVEKTFLDIPRVLRSADSVAQSTSEAHGSSNPRRPIASFH